MGSPRSGLINGCQVTCTCNVRSDSASTTLHCCARHQLRVCVWYEECEENDRCDDVFSSSYAVCVLSISLTAVNFIRHKRVAECASGAKGDSEASEGAWKDASEVRNARI